MCPGDHDTPQDAGANTDAEVAADAEADVGAEVRPARVTPNFLQGSLTCSLDDELAPLPFSQPGLS